MKQTLFEYIPDIFDIINNDVELTPIEKQNNIYVKRNDLFKIFDVNGAKAKQAYALISVSDAIGVVTAGARYSPQIQIVANICKYLKKKCICHTIKGKMTKELLAAEEDGAKVIIHKNTWHNNVIISYAKKDAFEKNYLYIPFGMESWEAIKQTALQVKNVPFDINKIVISAGSGINLCGLLWGIKLYKRNIKVKAIQIGIDINKILEKYAPYDYKDYLEIVKTPYKYSTKIKAKIDDIILDPIYEAKCFEYLEDNCLFWIIGKRR